MNTGERIIKARTKKGWNQRELARRVNLNASVMNRIESGDRAIRDDELVRLAKALGVSTDYLLGITNDKETELTEEARQMFGDPDLYQFYFEKIPQTDEQKLRKYRRMIELMEEDEKK